MGKVALVLKNQPDIEFMVEGHTDNAYSKGVLVDNWDLSVKERHLWSAFCKSNMDWTLPRWPQQVAASINLLLAIVKGKAKPPTQNRIDILPNWMNSLNCLKKLAKPQKIIEKAISTRTFLCAVDCFMMKDKMSIVKVGLVQMSCTANKEENLQKALEK